MPYISYNGQLYKITQAQYDSYTIGSPLPAGAVLTNPASVAAGGTVTNNDSVTTPILTENTTNNTPNQTLVINSTAVITAARTADITDPYIRARLGLPALSEVQTLSGAIANVNFGNVGNTVGNLVTSFGNTVSNISLGDIGNVASNVASSFGNAVSDVGNTFSNIGNTVSDAATAVGNSVSNIGDYFSGNTATTISDSQAANTDSTTVSTSTADAGSGTTVGTTTDAVPASAVDTAPDAVSSAVDPQASLAPGEEIVPNDQINTSPAELDALAASQGVAGEEGNITADTLARDPGSYSADELNAIADAQGVAGEEGNITADTLARDPGSFTADELNAIAEAQGVAGEEGNITADSLAKDPGSFTADELNAIAEAQGVAGEEGNITSDSLAKDPGSYSAAELDAIAEAQGVANGDGPIEPTNTGEGTSADSANASANIQGLVKSAQQQQTIADQRKQINNGDWRVRLRLAPQANYLYRAAKPGILQPLAVTDGIIFPYTPAISTAYRANYNNYDLTHSNYRGYFYQNSYVDAVNLTATFTAQDTNDANYLLAVIHFLRSATKMFYGQDSQRGSPPPVVYLSGLGDYQFREHACLISSFQYNLPADVDYIRAGSPNNNGLNLNSLRDRQSVATNSIFGSVNRLAAAFLTKGAINQNVSAAAPPTLGLTRPTYVPTKIEIQLTLMPIQSRQQVSKQFSLDGFASGDLLKKGFW